MRHTYIDLIEHTDAGHVEVRLKKFTGGTNPDGTPEFRYHRTSILRGQDPAEVLADVVAHITTGQDQANYEPPPPEECNLVVSMCRAAHGIRRFSRAQDGELRVRMRDGQEHKIPPAGIGGIAAELSALPTTERQLVTMAAARIPQSDIDGHLARVAARAAAEEAERQRATQEAAEAAVRADAARVAAELAARAEAQAAAQRNAAAAAAFNAAVERAVGEALSRRGL